MNPLHELAMAMMAHDADNAHRIQHFLKVHAFARLIAQGEGIDEQTQFVLEAAAYVHDIGIKPAVERCGACPGPLQEELGPPLARSMMEKLGFDQQVIDRVCWLVGHHHTYTDIQGDDYRILVEADFLVNLHEHGDQADAVRAAEQTIFRTATGRHILHRQFEKILLSRENT